MSSLSDQSSRLIESLRSARAYHHPVDEIRVLETHISWVILTGEYAYKLKKPVDLGFLDFTTLERREFYCHEELRLNRRLAPELYLGVVPITGSPEAPSMADAGTPIDFAVQMRQFSQDSLLSHVLQRQALTPEHIDALAREIAEFHGRIAISSADDPHGAPDVVRQATEDNLADLGLDHESDAAVDRIHNWCWSEFAARKDQFLSRKQQGFVRECHGDMHLGNMLLLDGKPVMFDCIEFNERFRWIDVLSEVAFAVMDLEDRGHSAGARRLLSAYLEETGDYGGLAVFRYYLVYRALVRAKVTHIRLRQDHITPNERPTLLTEYRGYLRLAERHTCPARPLLAITHGPSGSGKSTIAQAIVEAVGAVRIRSDVERKRLLGFNQRERTTAAAAGDVYSADATDRTYTRLAALASAVLGAGHSAVVDATFLKRDQRRRFRELAHQLDVPFLILDLQATEDDLRKRVASRATVGRDASEADLAVLAQQLATREPLDDQEQVSAIHVPSDRPDAAVSALLKQIADG